MKAALHRWTDHALVALRRKGKLFSHGFGDRARLARVVDAIASSRVSMPLETPVVRWEAERERFGVRVSRGSFRSPLHEELPTESKQAEVELLLPRGPARPPIVLLLAATSEEGFGRRRLFAAPLLRRGIGVLSLENPFYGSRRPAGQEGSFVRTVAEQFAMNYATVLEGRGLLAWLRGEGFERICASGFSQGGMMAAFAAVVFPHPVAVAPCAAGLTAHAIFLDAALSIAIDWDRLSRDAGTLAEARNVFERALDPISLVTHAPPTRPELAIIVGARHDGFVPPRDVEALHRHWKGSELRWMPSGHVTGAALYNGAHRRAIADTLARF